jgi:DNA-binding MarR family transcriptional regulator
MKRQIDDKVNDLCKTWQARLGRGGLCWQSFSMGRKPKQMDLSQGRPEQDAELAPITAMMSSRLMVLANLLRRGAMLRYKRTAGLSSVEYGLVANLGRQPPMSVVRLAEAVGLDKGQISRALADLVSRKLVAKAVNPRDNREVLVSLTKAGLAAHDAIVAGGQERNRRLLADLSEAEVAMLLGHLDRLTEKAAKMLADERDLG